MRRLLLKFIGIAAALMAAVMLWIVVTLPPAARRPKTLAVIEPTTVTGAYHVHSSRSDGSGTVDDIAQAAARAGLHFVILTDHGDATRPLETSYRHGVLCIDAVEISTIDGHVVALNLQATSPFPLAGETVDVVEDIHRLGGWAIAAHPDSPRADLGWRSEVPVDGFEWFNVDSEWRAHGIGSLAATAARAWFRAPESVATLFQNPTRSFERWDAALRTRPTFTLAALDAHARVGAEGNGEAPGAMSLSLPGYETMFRTMTQTVRLNQPFSGDAQRDAAAVLAALATGHSYSVVRAFVDAPRALDFRAVAGTERVDFGGSLAADGPVALHAAVPEEFNAKLVLRVDGREVASGISRVVHEATRAGAYRVEAFVGDATMPWIVSNAIHVGRATAPPPVAVTTTSPVNSSTAGSLPPATWLIEADPTSTATTSAGEATINLRYHLGPGAPAGQYAAIASGASGEAVVERIEFTATSLRPIRLSLQVRLGTGTESYRWRRSVYVDDVPRRISLALADMVPVEPQSPRPDSARVQAVLFVIDTVNARPGDAGDVQFRDVRFVAARSDRR